MSQFYLFLIALVFVLGVILHLLSLPRLMRLARESEGWLKTRGKIIESSCITKKSGNRQRESAHIVYEYIVSSQRFSNDRVSFEYYSPTDRVLIENLLAEYPEGESVYVYYDPSNPAESVLKPGPQKNNRILLIILALIFLIAGSWVFYCLFYNGYLSYLQSVIKSWLALVS